MFNIKLVLRNLLKKSSYTILNITGLAIGFACVFAVTVWVTYEFSYDKHLPDADRTYRLTFETVTSGNRIHFARCYEKWIRQIPGVFPQIEEMVRLEPYRHTALKVNENKIYSDRVFATDSNFFNVFGIDLLYGDVESVLNEPYSAVISSSLAGKFFGDANPVGQTILLSGEYDTTMTLFTIKGLMKDTPENSHIHFDILTSFVNPQESPAWAYVYLLLRKGTDPDEILEGLPSFINKVETVNDQKIFTPYLQNITDIHLYSKKDREVEPNGNITNIILFIIIAVVLLFVSCINYYNLNKARLLALEKQIHVLRIAGSDNNLIILQSLTESCICVALSLLLAVILLGISANFSYLFFGTSLLSGGFGKLLSSWPIIIAIPAVSVIVGSLPVFLYILRSQNSLSGIKESPAPTGSILSSYGLLMTLQFGLSIVLMVSTITI
jgi:putative ABC transport system permease protein